MHRSGRNESAAPCGHDGRGEPMKSVSNALRVRRFQELNEPQIFSWRNVKKKLQADEIISGAVERNGRTVYVVITLKWRNKAHRVADLIAYDEENGCCLLGTARFEKQPNATELRRVCREHGEAYATRLWGVAKGVADPLHQNSKLGYEKHKRQLRRKLEGDGRY